LSLLSPKRWRKNITVKALSVFNQLEGSRPPEPIQATSWLGSTGKKTKEDPVNL